MRILYFLLSAIATITLVIVLNAPLNIAGSQLPPIGQFISPHHGFWQNAEPANYSFNENLKFKQLAGKVEVYFDDRLVPHVYADTESDAWFVQGYLHARFRLWQMEFQTHAAAGRLSEILGDSVAGRNMLEIDRSFRRLGMVYAAERSLAQVNADPLTKTANDAYTNGVNAYIASLRPQELPIEYKLLNYKPEKWTPLKSQLFLKYMSFSMTGKDHDFELTNARNFFNLARFAKLYPDYADSLDPIIPRGTVFPPPSVVVKQPASVDTAYYHHTVYDTIIPATVPQPHPDNGSNNWALSGSKTKSGAPILCNDPHLDLNLPSAWYEMEIVTPSFHTYGVSFPGAPSIEIGFNDSLAWGITNAGRDVKDYFEIRFKDSSRQQYLYNGEWRNTTFRDEIIKVKNGPSDTQHIAMTVFGPVIYDSTFQSPAKDGKNYAVRWSAHNASNEMLTYLRLDRAHNYADFIRAIAVNQCPAQNFIFASKTGDIAIRQQGQFPAKWYRQGDFVMPGFDSSYDWQGYIPSRENPTQYNPQRGFVSSANQLAADTAYPYYLGGDQEIYRGRIINRLLADSIPVTFKDMQAMQTDTYDEFARIAKPLLVHYLDPRTLSSEEVPYFQQVRDWNMHDDLDQTGASIFNIWWDSLKNEVYGDEFSQSPLPLLWPDESVLLEALIRDSSYSFVDNITTPYVETINDIALQSFRKAMKAIQNADDEHRLAWGAWKDTRLSHLLNVPAFSLLHLQAPGGRNAINATSSNHGPSWRMIVELTPTTKAYGIYAGGQSGNPGSRFYDNFVGKWSAGEYYPLLFLTLPQAQVNPRVKWKMTFAKA